MNTNKRRASDRDRVPAGTALARHAALASLLTALVVGCAGTPDKPAAAEAEPERREATAQPEAPAATATPMRQEEAAAQPQEPSPLLRPDHPERYEVVKGDTLWDIASMFLNDPWRWPEIWYHNPQVENPHLIYPGDILTLTYIDGKPRIQVQRGRPTVKLSPRARVESLEHAIPTIPIDAVKPFLNRTRVVSEDTLEDAPYIVSSAGEHLITGAGDRVYVRGIEDEGVAEYEVVRGGEVYRNPDDPDDILGYEALHIGDAVLQRGGDPATLHLVRSTREALVGDRLVPAGGEEIIQSFTPRGPEQEVAGEIISVLDGVSQIGQHDVVVLDLGEQQGMAVGHVLTVMEAGETIADTIKGQRVELSHPGGSAPSVSMVDETVTLPDERAGTVMVFRVFERVSYALVMDATRAIHVGDRVTNP